MTWEEVADLPREATLALLPVGALEAHGPHLPLRTDGIIAEAMAAEGARRLADDGWTVLRLPTLDYTPAPFAAGFPGTLSQSSAAFEPQLDLIARSLERQGFRHLVLVNAHFDPENVAGLRAFVERWADRDDLRIVFPDLTRRPLASRLTDEFRSGACHAGRYEGSLVLAARPDLFRGEIAETLAPHPVSLVDAISAGLETFEEAGGDRAYFGDPAAATAEEGRETLRELGRILREAVRERLGTRLG